MSGLRIGWGDESLSGVGEYLLGVVLTDAEGVEGIRDVMRGLLLAGQRKVHWRDESHKRRMQISEAVAALPVDGLVVVRVSSGERQERQRRKCFERLLWKLEGCDQLVMEARGAGDDRRDRQLIDSLRRRHVVAASLRASHAPGPSDPALWAADALCGAVANSRSGEAVYLETITSAITVKLIEVDRK